jgi:hypothetical protein
MAIADHDVPKDSNTEVEIFARALSTAYAKSGNRLPLGFAYGTDNTCREAKNQKVHRVLISMVLLGVFRWTLHGLLRPGHTHNGLDACFGTTSKHIGGKDFDDPEELIEIINRLFREKKLIALCRPMRTSWTRLQTGKHGLPPWTSPSHTSLGQVLAITSGTAGVKT